MFNKTVTSQMSHFVQYAVHVCVIVLRDTVIEAAPLCPGF